MTGPHTAVLNSTFKTILCVITCMCSASVCLSLCCCINTSAFLSLRATHQARCLSIHMMYLITLRYHGAYLLTYSMGQSPSWEAKWFCSYSRNSPHFWNPKVHHRSHKCPPLVPILSQLHPVLTTPSHFLKIQLNIILPSASGPSQWSLSLRFPPPEPTPPRENQC